MHGEANACTVEQPAGDERGQSRRRSHQASPGQVQCGSGEQLGAAACPLTQRESGSATQHRASQRG
jgi:hypothetical protein